MDSFITVSFLKNKRDLQNHETHDKIQSYTKKGGSGMPISNKELVAEQKRRLYPLLYTYTATNDELTKDILKGFINPLVTEMDEEDVAFVQVKVEKDVKDKFGK